MLPIYAYSPLSRDRGWANPNPIHLLKPCSRPSSTRKSSPSEPLSLLSSNLWNPALNYTLCSVAFHQTPFPVTVDTLRTEATFLFPILPHSTNRWTEKNKKHTHNTPMYLWIDSLSLPLVVAWPWLGALFFWQLVPAALCSPSQLGTLSALQQNT